jgi:hypothetical protein
MYTVAYDNADIVIRINKDAIDKRTLSSFLEFVEMEEIRRKSRLTAAKAASLTKEIKRSVWSQLKDKVLED